MTPDSNWFVAQCAGAVSAMVFAGARGGTTYSSINSFTTTHSGTAQYLLGGLNAGTYTVKVNGLQVSGSPFTVAAGDNSIEFTSTAGAVALSSGGSLPVGAVGTAIGGGAAAHGNVAIH
jgi:hypothetical protein